MRENGKILFYNESNGSGIIILENKTKIKFDVQEWNDFDCMPSMGLWISCEIHESNAKNIELVFSQEKQSKKCDLKPAEPIESDKDVSLGEESALEENSLSQPLKTAPSQYKFKNRAFKDEENKLDNLLNETNKILVSLNDNISLSVTIVDSMDKYFKIINKNVLSRKGYLKVNGRLNYLLARRFIWTTFNNLIDIDQHLVTPRIKSVSDDLKHMGKIYSNFEKKVKYPSVAFNDVFLTYQKEYKHVKKVNTSIKEYLNTLNIYEGSVAAQKKAKQEEIENATIKESKLTLTRELKILSGTYVDLVHMMANLTQRYKENSELLENFETKYKNDFYNKFLVKAENDKANLLEVLDAQAYLLDHILWKEAKVSRDIINNFRSSLIDGELNTKTYLGYYLNSLDDGKMNQSTQELIKLYNYLKEVQKEYIMILAPSVDDIMDYELEIKKLTLPFAVKSFIDALSSIKWAMQNSVKVLIVDSEIQGSKLAKYLDVYHSNLLSKPKLVIMGSIDDEIKSKYCINKQLSKNSSPYLMAKSVAEAIHCNDD